MFAVNGFITSTSQYWVGYELTILFAALLVMQFFFLPETLYPRASVRQWEERVGEASYHEEVKLKPSKWLQYLVRSSF